MNILKSSILALTGLVLASQAANAANFSTDQIFNDGDLLLGFRMTTGASKEYVVDLGNVYTGYDFTTSFTFANTGSAVKTDLSGISGFNTSSANFKWAVLGTDNSIADNWATDASSTPLKNIMNQAGRSGKIANVGFNAQNSVTTNPMGTVQANNNDFSWTNVLPVSGANFAGYLAEGGASSALDFYYLPGHSTAEGTKLGTISYDAATGNLNFVSATAPTAVPEPSTYAMMLGLGAAGLVGVLRRRALKA